MDRREYTDTVLSALRHVTRRERSAIRAEIDGHLEDHLEGLLELGYSPELAEERTLDAMGDPKEVGRELNRQYPLGWLIVGRMAMAAVLVFALVVAGPLWDTLRNTVVPNLQARWFPTTAQDLTEISFSGYEDEDGVYQALAKTAVDLDLRRTANGVTTRIYQVGLQDPAAEQTTAWFAVSFSAVNPFEKPSRFLGDSMRLEGQSAMVVTSFHSPYYCFFSGPVTRGQEAQVVWQGDGEPVSFTVPLPWKEAAE